MHPDKRRAGRAIRKQRRDARQDMNGQLAAIADAARAAAAACAIIADAFTAIARDVARVITYWASDSAIEQRPLWKTEKPD